MSDSTDECKECSILGTVVYCEVSFGVCGERWQNGPKSRYILGLGWDKRQILLCPSILPWSVSFFPVCERERERAIAVGRLALRFMEKVDQVNPSRAKVTSEQNNRCQWKRGQNLVAPITVTRNLLCLTLNPPAAWHQRINWMNLVEWSKTACISLSLSLSLYMLMASPTFWSWKSLPLSHGTCASVFARMNSTVNSHFSSWLGPVPTWTHCYQPMNQI